MGQQLGRILAGLVVPGPRRFAAASLDYSFVGWHDLTLCYRSRGWQPIVTRVATVPPPSSQDARPSRTPGP